MCIAACIVAVVHCTENNSKAKKAREIVSGLFFPTPFQMTLWCILYCSRDIIIGHSIGGKNALNCKGVIGGHRNWSE